MCGIAGIIRFNSRQVSPAEVKALTDAIVHRGPDGEGCWIHQSGNVGLGHRRLSILDLSELGSQPMHYADGRLTIVFNGEIFNFAELRTELQQKGYQFRSDTDTEVLLAAYHAWGKDCLHRFNGFWAFAIWDEQEQELWLARDRFGIKPLYYLLQTNQQFVFGSETIQFKYVQGYDRIADGPMVRYTLQNCWGIEGLGKTIFKGIEQVRPGHSITVKANGQVHHAAWWTTADHLVQVPTNYTEQVEQFRALFEDALKLRLRSDVSIASALSGGLDSSSVFAGIHHLVSRNKNLYRLPSEWQRAFIAVFPGTEQDEREYAEAVLQHTGGEGVFMDIQIGGDLPQRLINSVENYDTIYSTPLLIMDAVYGSMKQQGITVSMDGHGVDEMMYGYGYNVLNAYGHQRHNKEYASQIKEIYLNMIHPDEQNEAQKRFSFSGRFKGFVKRYAEKTGIGKQDQWNGWYAEASTAEAGLPAISIPGSFTGAEAQLYKDFHFTTLPTILRNFDRGAMRNSIEIRMPFLDYRLVSYVFSLPMESKLGNGYTKRILRDAMKGVLPESIRTRKLKTGFNAPLRSWFQQELRTLVLDEVSSKAFLENDNWNGKAIRDFAVTKTKQQNWSTTESTAFWPVLNAHLLFK